jgi:hypothetical protein
VHGKTFAQTAGSGESAERLFHLQRQVESLRHEFLQDGQLPLTDVLTEEGLDVALREIKAP